MKKMEVTPLLWSLYLDYDEAMKVYEDEKNKFEYGGGEKQDKENGVLIIRNSFPQLVDVDNLQAVHFGNIDQWLEVRE